MVPTTNTTFEALSVAGGYVYFLEPIIDGTTTYAIVRRVHRCGGEPLTLTKNFQVANTIRVDGTHVYFGNGTVIKRVAR
jgi:hypothetical protein